jgi:hypothetical protein
VDVIAAETQVRSTPSRAGLSPQSLGAIALAAGVAALTAAIAGSASWILLAAALAVWSICGWALYFRSRPSRQVVATLGTVLLLSAAIAALVALSGLYLLALGPSWIL